MKKIEVYTDASYSDATKDAIVGYVVYISGKQVAKNMYILADVQNIQDAECYAIYYAFSDLFGTHEGRFKVKLYMDQFNLLKVKEPLNRVAEKIMRNEVSEYIKASGNTVMWNLIKGHAPLHEMDKHQRRHSIIDRNLLAAMRDYLAVKKQNEEISKKIAGVK